jgi:ribosomal protein L29
MTHRKSVVLLPLHSNKDQVKESMLKELHSIYPVYGENHDDIVGVVNLKSIFATIDKEQFNLRFQAVTGKLTATGRQSIVRREIARIKTILRERELGD